MLFFDYHTSLYSFTVTSYGHYFYFVWLFQFYFGFAYDTNFTRYIRCLSSLEQFLGFLFNIFSVTL